MNQSRWCAPAVFWPRLSLAAGSCQTRVVPVNDLQVISYLVLERGVWSLPSPPIKHMRSSLAEICLPLGPLGAAPLRCWLFPSWSLLALLAAEDTQCWLWLCSCFAQPPGPQLLPKVSRHLGTDLHLSFKLGGGGERMWKLCFVYWPKKLWITDGHKGAVIWMWYFKVLKWMNGWMCPSVAVRSGFPRCRGCLLTSHLHVHKVKKEEKKKKDMFSVWMCPTKSQLLADSHTVFVCADKELHVPVGGRRWNQILTRQFVFLRDLMSYLSEKARSGGEHALLNRHLAEIFRLKCN